MVHDADDDHATRKKKLLRQGGARDRTGEDEGGRRCTGDRQAGKKVEEQQGFRK